MTSKFKKRVVIIGGGFAGIGCLKTLTQHDYLSVTLLEASDTLGGRINTIEGMGNVVLELGATFIHGEEGNSLYEIARNANILPAKIVNDVHKDIFLMSNGKAVSESYWDVYSNIVTDIFEEMVACAEKSDWSFVLYPHSKEWLKQSHSTIFPPSSITQYVRERFESITANRQCSDLDPAVTHNNDFPSQSSILDSILDNHLLREATLNGTSYSNNVDINSYNEFSYPLGDDSILLTYGYKGLVETMANDTGHLCAFTKKVCHIDWGNNESIAPVLVYCNDGSRYEADHVIITVSLGVLKDNLITFTPSLPSQKQTAIDKLGMGLLGKVILTFSTAILSDDIRRVSFLWRKEERESLSMKYPWVAYMYCMYHILDSNSWVFWFAGDEAKTIERLTDDEVIEGIVTGIELFLKKPISTSFTSIARAKWGLNELFKGSYSYNKTGSNKSDRQELAEPLGDTSTPLQLLFAGEATNGNNYSTTNGAYDTGVREGTRLLNHYNIIV